MGHVLLGNLPRTREWKDVVAFIRHGAGAAQVAQASAKAAKSGLIQAGFDRRVVECLRLLIGLVSAARVEDFAGAILDLGLTVSKTPDLIEIIAGVSEYLDGPGIAFRRTDAGDLAHAALCETLSEVIGGKLRGLFEASPSEVRTAFKSMGTNKQFSLLSKHFFGRFMTKILDYFLSKTLANHVGEGKRFPTLEKQSAFRGAFEQHCREASKIVEEFSGQWYSKHFFESKGDISFKKIAGFTSYAMKKLTDELSLGAGIHEQSL